MARLTQKLLPTKRLQRFILSGVAAFTLEYAAFFGLFYLAGLPLLVAHSLSFCCGLITSFALNRQWAFKQPQFRRGKTSQFTLYLMLALLNLAATSLILKGLHTIGVEPYLAKVLVIALAATWNFLIYRAIIFKPTKSLF